MTKRTVPKVLIQVSGGVVQVVTTNGHVEVALADWDNIKESTKFDHFACYVHPLSDKDYDKLLQTLKLQAVGSTKNNAAYENT